MRSIPLAFAAAATLALSAGAAAANGYYVTYKPVTHYVRRTVVVRERAWRPVVHRVHYRRAYAAPYYRPIYRPVVYRPVVYRPAYVGGYGYDYGWRHRRWEHERWERRRWEHRHWDHDRW